MNKEKNLTIEETFALAVQNHNKNNLKPKKGDCCVYCSYGNVKCPPIQKEECC